MTTKHPAPFSQELIPVFRDLLHKHHVTGPILDPFAGVGGIHLLTDWETWGVELEPEWAEQHPSTEVGDATRLRFKDNSFAAVVSSCCYGNRMSDHHNAQDGSHRRTYKHYLGRDLTPGNAGSMQWGQAYRDLHEKAWQEVFRVLEPEDGLFLLNIKDHHRAGKRAHVSNWHYKTIQSIGFELIDLVRVPTPGFRYGENREIRYPERILVFQTTKQHADVPLAAA